MYAQNYAITMLAKLAAVMYKGCDTKLSMQNYQVQYICLSMKHIALVTN